MQADFTIIGLGGLGAILASELVRRGFPVTAFEPDTVALSNLHRQLLYEETDLGRLKSAAAAERLGSLLTVIPEPFDLERHLDSLSNGVLIDASDNGRLKLSLDDQTGDTMPWLMIGSALGMEGLIWCRRGRSSRRLTDLFGQANPDFLRMTCAQSGVLGPFVNWVGGVMAQEAASLEFSATDAFFWRFQASPMKASRQEFHS